MAFVFRAAVRDDADGIADVHVASWRAGYAHAMPHAVLYADDFDSSRREFWRSWRFGPGDRLVVAVDDAATEAITGFAGYGPERERARGFTGRGEIWAFYLHPDVWGAGLAGRLLAHTEERLGAEGFVTAILWVLADNPRARRFYERHCWEPTGIEADFDADDARLPEVEYRKELA